MAGGGTLAIPDAHTCAVGLWARAAALVTKLLRTIKTNKNIEGIALSADGSIAVTRSPAFDPSGDDAITRMESLKSKLPELEVWDINTGTLLRGLEYPVGVWPLTRGTMWKQVHGTITSVSLSADGSIAAATIGYGDAARPGLSSFNSYGRWYNEAISTSSDFALWNVSTGELMFALAFTPELVENWDDVCDLRNVNSFVFGDKKYPPQRAAICMDNIAARCCQLPGSCSSGGYKPGTYFARLAFSPERFSTCDRINTGLYTCAQDYSGPSGANYRVECSPNLFGCGEDRKLQRCVPGEPVPAPESGHTSSARLRF